jgi:hypothetical protein
MKDGYLSKNTKETTIFFSFLLIDLHTHTELGKKNPAKNVRFDT